MKKIVSSLLITFVLMGIGYYIFLPAINIMSPGFWMFIILNLIIFASIYFIIDNKDVKRPNLIRTTKTSMICYTISILIILMIILVNIFGSAIFNANSYYSRISVNQDTVFSDDIKEVDFNKIPLLDKDSSTKLGDRKLGSQSEWVSQYYVSNLYTQINYNDEIVRVTPLEYDGIIKYFSNRKDGIKGYISVNSVNGDANLVTLDNGMRYMPSAMFNENLSRKLRFSYPTYIFEEESFEIDNDGNPYWIVPYVSYGGIGIREKVEGVVILDPITGNSTSYKVEDVPSWVDHVYPSSLVIDELNNWGEFGNGFLNSIFGQKNVVNTTDGYNYLILNDDVYLYTGVTSVSSDESNIGFVLTNLRTHETNFYSVSGAEEYSAASSAEGLVQEKGYTSTFPLLINLNNRPTYLLSLKDNAGLVKMYAFVDVEDYQKVVTSDASLGIEEAAKKYLKEVNFSDSIVGEVTTEEITINKIYNAVIDGNTYYYFTDMNNNYYSSIITNNKELLPFLSSGDKVRVSYTDGNVRVVISIEKVQ